MREKSPPAFTVAKSGRMWVVLRDGKEDVRVLPCRTEIEAKKQLENLLRRNAGMRP